MNFNLPAASSPSSSNSSVDPNSNHRNNGGDSHNSGGDPRQSWWESISKARSRIHILSSLIPSSTTDPSLSISFLADSDRPARSLLSSFAAYSAVSSSLSAPTSGSGSDPLCNWLYDTFLTADPDLRLVVLSFIPLLSGLYLSRIHSNSTSSLAGFEAVLLSLYAAETKSRNGKPVLISLPDLSLPSLYHTPPAFNTKSNINPNPNYNLPPKTGIIAPPLEPQTAVKSTKRACIVGVALDCYYKQISQMPVWSKLDICKFAADWAGQDCPCKSEFDEINTFSDEIKVEEIDDVGKEMGRLVISENGSYDRGVKGARIPLPWELLQPLLRIMGHCLLGPLNSNEVKDAASVAVRCLYARASHELVPQALLATRSLIQLDNRAGEAVQLVAVNAASSNANTPSKAKKSNANTPSKAKKPEILLVSK